MAADSNQMFVKLLFFKNQAKPRQSIFATKQRDDLAECSNCGRTFAPDRVEKHEVICQKTSTKRRKVYDMTKKRVEGTEAEVFVRRKGRQPVRVESKVKD